MESCDLLVELLGEDVDLATLVLARVALDPKLDLREGLVGEAGAHHERWVASGASKVEETSLGEDNHAVAVREDPSVHLRLDVVALDAGELGEAKHVDLIVEVANVANNGIVLHLCHVGSHDDVLVACGCHDNVNLRDDSGHLDDAVALHARLESADGVNLCDIDDAARVLHCRSASLSDVAKSANQDPLAGKHDVSGAHDTVRERVAASIDVIELGLCNAVVNVDGRDEQVASLCHLV